MASDGKLQLNGDGVEDEDDDYVDGDGLEAWQRTYTDERSWEALQEDESGLLRPIDNAIMHHMQFRRHLRFRSPTASSMRIRKGLIRFVYIVLDFSREAAELDYRPNRMLMGAKNVEVFIREFFDQNPLSKIGLVSMKDGIAQLLTELGGSPESHIKALMGKLECSGDASLQNALDLVRECLDQIPLFGHREALILYSSLSTCDPGDIMETIQQCKASRIRCSVIGLSAEVFILKHLSQETGGSYSVALNEDHFRVLLMDQAPPPPAMAEFAVANLIKMGFPQRVAEDSISICCCHNEAKAGEGFICPRCKARVCELPTECRVCGLTLVSSPHLARSYHHLFPVAPFVDRVPPAGADPQAASPACFGCRQAFLHAAKLSVACPNCKRFFCLECDMYIHESLHNCPGCESLPPSSPLPPNCDT